MPISPMIRHFEIMQFNPALKLSFLSQRGKISSITTY